MLLVYAPTPLGTDQSVWQAELDKISDPLPTRSTGSVRCPVLTWRDNVRPGQERASFDRAQHPRAGVPPLMDPKLTFMAQS
eukprot:3373929-Rhodomonas_salina.2